jgi:hypothetical protein
MRTNRLFQGLGAVALSLVLSSCMNMVLLGVPLGPQGGTGLSILGVMAEDGSCVYDPTAKKYMVEGAVDFVKNQEYIALVAVENPLQENSQTKTVQQAPNYGGWGSTNTSDAEIIGTHINYEYVVLGPLQTYIPGGNGIPPARGGGSPLEGTPIGGLSAAAAGVIPADTIGGVTVSLIGSTFWERVNDLEDIKNALQDDNSTVLVVVRYSLEGRNGLGQRFTSNEATFRIRLIKPNSSRMLNNCQWLQDPGNQEACVLPSRPVLKAKQPCLQPGQDIQSCTCS